jgi:glycosyltransferase involved in cell wall biosynthesis
MTRIFVNGISAKSGGGKSILTNFLKVARHANDNFSYCVAVPCAEDYAELSNERVEIISLPHMSHSTMIPFASMTVLRNLPLRLGCDLVLNFATIPIPTRLPQVFLCDWPYAAFLDSPAWNISTRKDRLIRHAKLFFFKRFLRFVDVMIAQNDVLAEHISANYQLRNVEIVPNAVSLDNLGCNVEFDYSLGDGFKLLCLSRYYSHKNIEVFLPLAEKVRSSSLPVKIVTTLSPYDGYGAKRFLEEVARRGLGDVIVNVGTVAMENVPALYAQTDALLLPTLLESFSGTYVEAMYHRRAILTSDLPFARGVCKDAAFYFDPNDADDILRTVVQVMSDTNDRKKKTEAGAVYLSQMPSWIEVYSRFTSVFRRELHETLSDT